MDGERINKCWKAIQNIKAKYELHTFTTSISFNVPHTKPVADGGTSVSSALKELASYLRHGPNRYVYILTDDEDDYDYAPLSLLYSSLDNHKYFLLDITGTNTERLKLIFPSGSLMIINDINNLGNSMSDFQLVIEALSRSTKQIDDSTMQVQREHEALVASEQIVEALKGNASQVRVKIDLVEVDLQLASNSQEVTDLFETVQGVQREVHQHFLAIKKAKSALVHTLEHMQTMKEMMDKQKVYIQNLNKTNKNPGLITKFLEQMAKYQQEFDEYKQEAEKIMKDARLTHDVIQHQSVRVDDLTEQTLQQLMKLLTL